MKWAIPYIDQPLDFWVDLIEQAGDQIKEVYFPLSGKLIGSGRPFLPQAHLSDFLRWSGIRKTVLLNPICLPGSVEAVGATVVDELQRLRDQCEVDGATVANFKLARRIRDVMPDYILTASVLLDICSPMQILTLGDVFDGIVPSSRIMRSFGALKSLRRAFKGRIRLIVNEGCLPGCVERVQHFYEMANPPAETPGYLLCEVMLERHPWLRLTGAWVLPQHLDFFDGLYDELKLSGRVTLSDPDKYRLVLNSYLQRRPLSPDSIGGGPASVLESLRIDDDFYRKTLHCDRQCDICNLCRDYWAEAVGR